MWNAWYDRRLVSPLSTRDSVNYFRASWELNQIACKPCTSRTLHTLLSCVHVWFTTSASTSAIPIHISWVAAAAAKFSFLFFSPLRFISTCSQSIINKFPYFWPGRNNKPFARRTQWRRRKQYRKSQGLAAPAPITIKTQNEKHLKTWFLGYVIFLFSLLVYNWGYDGFNHAPDDLLYHKPRETHPDIVILYELYRKGCDQTFHGIPRELCTCQRTTSEN